MLTRELICLQLFRGKEAAALDTLPSTFTYAQARRAGLTKHRIYQLRDEGAIESIGRGLYVRSDAEPTDLDLVEIGIRAPAATLCLTTALARHGLTDAVPARLDVAIPRGLRPPSTGAPVTWHQFATDTFSVGRDVIELDVGSIGLYSAERSIVDAFRLRGTEGHELAVEAMRQWLPQGQPSELLRVAEHFPRALPAIRQALEVLL